MRHWLPRTIVACFGTIAAGSSLAQPPDSGGQVVELGDREQIKVYPLTLTAQNVNCQTPQDFRFDLSAAPFVVALGDPVVRQVPPGGQGHAAAQMRFALVAPGPQQAVVATICETCRPIPLFGNNCRADKQLVTLKVNVIAAPPPAAPAQPRADRSDQSSVSGASRDGEAALGIRPIVRGQCVADLSVNLSAGLEGLLDAGQKRALDDARNKAKAANGAQAAAYEDLEAKKRKKKKCEEELAALKAEAAAKAQTAADAANAANAAEGAANAASGEAGAAQAALDSYDADVAAAEKAAQKAKEAAVAQEKAFLAIATPGAGAAAAAKAADAMKAAQAAQKDAEAKAAAVKASKAAREAALAAAKAAQGKAAGDAAAAKAAAGAAQAASDAAAAAVAAKELECRGLAEAAGAQEAKVQDANRNAQNAGAGLASAEEKAAGQAARNAKDLAACKREECEEKKKKWREHFRRLANARKALEALNYFTEGPAPPPDELWKSYTELGYQKFMEAAQAAVESIGTETLPTTVAGVAGTALDVLQAAYGIAKIAQAGLTPGTYAHGRTEGEDLRAWLVKNNFAHDTRGDTDAKAVEHEMERLMKDPNAVAKDLDQAMKEIEACEKEIADLDAKAQK